MEERATAIAAESNVEESDAIFELRGSGQRMKPFAAEPSLDRPRNSTPVVKSCRLGDARSCIRLMIIMIGWGRLPRKSA